MSLLDEEILSYLSTDGSTDIHKLDMGEFLFDLLDFGVGHCPSDETFEGADGIAEIGSLNALCRFANRPLLDTERDKGSSTQCEFRQHRTLGVY